MNDLILAYDFETSGIPDWHEPSGSPQQPHIVQAGALLVDAQTRQTVSSLDVIVRPDGWEIPQEVVDIHGITTEHASRVGVPEKVALDMLLALWRACDLRVGHSQQFDARIARIAIKRYHDDDLADEWKAGAAECTGWLARPIMGIAGRRMPKLSDAYEHFLDKPLEGAHTAMGDARAAMDLYWAIQDHNNPAPAEEPAAADDEIEV